MGSRRSSIYKQHTHVVCIQTGASTELKGRCWPRSRRKFLGKQPYIHSLSEGSLSEAVTRVYKCYSIPASMKPLHSIRSLLVHPKDKPRLQDVCECVYKIPCNNCDKTYIGETGRTFGVKLQEHQQEVAQRDDARSTSKSAATEQNKSAVTDHAITLNHWDRAKVINRESNKMDRWIKEALYIRNKQDKSMNRDEGPINSLISMTSCSPQQRHLAPNRS